MNPLKNRSKIIAALSFLIAAHDAFSAELASRLNPGQGREIEVNLKPTTVYVRKNATNAAGPWAMIDENTTKTEGVSSISKNALTKNEAVVFDRIAIAFGEGDAAGKEGAVDYNASKLPVVLRNATLLIRQNGREVVEIPVADLGKTISPGSNEDYYHDLESFQYLVDDQPMEFLVKFPDGQVFAPSAAGKFNYVELRLRGFKTARKQK